MENAAEIGIEHNLGLTCDTDAGDDEAGDAQNKVDEGKDFESLTSGAHGWSFRYEYANLTYPNVLHIW